MQQDIENPQWSGKFVKTQPTSKPETNKQNHHHHQHHCLAHRYLHVNSSTFETGFANEAWIQAFLYIKIQAAGKHSHQTVTKGVQDLDLTLSGLCRGSLLQTDNIPSVKLSFSQCFLVTLFVGQWAWEFNCILPPSVLQWGRLKEKCWLSFVSPKHAMETSRLFIAVILNWQLIKFPLQIFNDWT